MKDNNPASPNFFEDDEELTVDGSPYKKPNYLARSYVIGPLILMSLLVIGSIILIASVK